MGNTGSATSKWMSDLDKNDIEILNGKMKNPRPLSAFYYMKSFILALELSTLQTPQLIDKVKDLFDFAYQLGSEECTLLFSHFKIKELNQTLLLFVSYFSEPNDSRQTSQHLGDQE